jgi:putative chitinase
MNHAAFFAALRRRDSGVFGTSLSQAQVDVMEAILSATTALSNAEVAYVMATAYHESGSPRMVPTVENLNYTSAARIRQVWPSRFPTDAAAQPFARNPRKLANHVYNGRLGNRPGSDDGWAFRGRGLDHLTGRDNYARAVAIVGADVLAQPELMLRPEIAVRSLVHGMTTGRYRGHKLADFTLPADFSRARGIVNADVAKNGALVAGYARAFLAALEAAGRRPKGAPAPNAVASRPKPQAPVAAPPQAAAPTPTWVRRLRAFLPGMGQ